MSDRPIYGKPGPEKDLQTEALKAIQDGNFELIKVEPVKTPFPIQVMVGAIAVSVSIVFLALAIYVVAVVLRAADLLSM